MSPDTHDRLIGALIEQSYRVEKRIGEGGMGVVYLADQISPRRKVAVKVLDARFSTEQLIRRFAVEAKAITRLNHTNILTVYDYGQDPKLGILYLVTEYLEGQALMDWIEANQPSDPYFVLQLGMQLCEALGYAHDQGVIHRDLTPKNIFLVSRGRRQMPVILDFGLAKLAQQHAALTKTGQVVGTPPYMSPEQARGSTQVDHRADIYALGCVLYHALTGRRPFYESSTMGYVIAHLEKTPPAPSTVRPDLARLTGLDSGLAKALQKRPGNRFQTAYSFGDRLSRICPPAEAEAAQQAPVWTPETPMEGGRRGELPRELADTSLQVPSPIRALSRPKRRRMVMLATIAALLLTGLLGSVAVLRLLGYLHWEAGGQRGPPLGRKLLVLPFRYIGPDRSLEYIGGGLKEILVGRLASIRDLAVTSGSYQDISGEQTLGQIGKRYGVDLVLAGSYQVDRKVIGYSFLLVEVATGRTLWSDSGRTNLDNVVEFEHALSENMFRHFKLKITAVELDRIRRARTTNLEAATLHIKGRYLLSKLYETGHKQYIDDAERVLGQAVRLDDSFVDAHIGLGEVYWQHINFTHSDDPAWLDRAAAEADQALTLDNDSYQAHALKSRILLQQGQKDGAIEALRRAVALAPGAEIVLRVAMSIYQLCGLTDREAVIRHKIAKWFPNPAVADAYVAHTLLRQGRFHEARDMLEALRKREPNNYSVLVFLTAAYRFTKQHQKGIEIAEAIVKTRPDVKHPRVLLAIHYASVGRRDRALTYLRQCERYGKVDFDMPYHIACVYAQLGDLDQLFFWLETMLRHGNHNYPLLSIDPCFDKIRSLQRFRAFTARLKERWQKYRQLKFFAWEQ